MLSAYILISGIKCKKKIFFKNFSKNFSPKKISYTPPYEFWRPRKKNFFFSFNSIYQNVRTERLKWRVRKVDITSGCLTIMVYFCNNEWVFILTKVQLYCVFVFGNYEVSNTFLLSHKAYILISGIKCEKKNFKIFPQNFPPKKIRIPSHSNFGVWEKNFFFSFYSRYQNVSPVQ